MASSFPTTMRTSLAFSLLVLALAVSLLATFAEAQNATTTVAPTTKATPRAELTWEGYFVLISVVIMILCMALNLVGSLAALFGLSTLFATIGIISVEQLFAGFVNKGMLTIALMFVIVHPIAHLPRANWFIEKIIGPCACGNPDDNEAAGAAEEGAVVVPAAEKPKTLEPWERSFMPRLKLLLFSFIVSPFVENVPHVSVMAPVVTRVCRKLNIPTSQMLLPMALCVCTANWLLIGSASNLIIEAMMEEYGVEPLGFFELIYSNGPVSLILILYYLFAAPLLLPRRTTDTVDLADEEEEAAKEKAKKEADDSHSVTTAADHSAAPTDETPAMAVPPSDDTAAAAAAAAAATTEPMEEGDAAAGTIALSDPKAHLTVAKTGLNGARDFAVHFRVPLHGDLFFVGQPAKTVLESFPAAARNKIRLLFLLRQRCAAQLVADGHGAHMTEPFQATSPNTAHPTGSCFDPDAYDIYVIDSDDTHKDTAVDAHPEHANAAPAEEHDVLVHRGDILVVGGDASQLRTFRHLARLHWVVADQADNALSTEVSPRDGDAETATASPRPRRAPSGLDLNTDAYAKERIKDRESEHVQYHASWPAGLVTIGADQQTKLAPFALVVVSNENPAVQTRVSDNVFTRAYHSSIVGVKTSGGEHVWGRDMGMHILHPGDTLLLRTTLEFLKAQSALNSDFYLVDPIDFELDAVLTAHYIRVPACFKQFASTRVTLRGDTAYLRLPDWYQNLTLVVFLGVVVAAMFGQSLPLVCAIGICALVVLNLLTVQQAVRYVDWNVYATGSFAFGIGFGMTESGLALWMGQLLSDAGVDGFPLILLLYTLTALIGSIVSNRGAIQVMFPIAFAIFSQRAGAHGMSAAAAAIANGAMGGFITPYGLTPALIVAGPGQYLPKHYIIFGGPLFILYSLLGSLMISIAYNFW